MLLPRLLHGSEVLKVPWDVQAIFWILKRLLIIKFVISYFMNTFYQILCCARIPGFYFYNDLIIMNYAKNLCISQRWRHRRWNFHRIPEVACSKEDNSKILFFFFMSYVIMQYVNFYLQHIIKSLRCVKNYGNINCDAQNDLRSQKWSKIALGVDFFTPIPPIQCWNRNSIFYQLVKFEHVWIFAHVLVM